MIHILFRLLFSYLLVSRVFSTIQPTLPSLPCDVDQLKDDVLDFVDESLIGLDQEDPVLIEAIHKLLVPPPEPKVPYNLSSLKKEGEFFQVPILLKLFGPSKKDGFFIEAGAHDGEVFSNTLYFEKVLGWKGLLVEPNPETFKILLDKNRKAWAFPRCLSPTTNPDVFDFDVAGLYGGIIKDGRRLSDESFKEGTLLSDELRDARRTIKIQCFPLYSIIKALGNPTIDLLSLDIEGADFQVLKSIPWDKVDIRVLLIEVYHFGKIFEGTETDLDNFLDEIGFKFYKSVALDNIYIRKDFKINQKNKDGKKKKKKPSTI